LSRFYFVKRFYIHRYTRSAGASILIYRWRQCAMSNFGGKLTKDVTKL